MSTPLPPHFETLDAPVFHWAAQRPEAIAIDDGETSLTFSELAGQLRRRADVLRREDAPAIVWVEEGGGVAQRLIDFLGIIHSGRCAAVGDPDWPVAVRERVHAQVAQPPAALTAPTALSPFYIGFTSGSTGLPKGFCRHHRSWTESFRVARETFGEALSGRVLSPGRVSHSLFLFGALLGLWSGAGVRMQNRFSARQALSALGQDAAPCLVAVPSQLLVILALAERRAVAPLDRVRLVLISGARWMRHRTPALRALFPNAQLVEFYGTSEMSFVAWMQADEAAHPSVVGTPFSNVEIDIRERQDGAEEGLIYVRSPMLFLDYVGNGHDPTAALRDGEWLSVKDLGFVDAQRRLRLIGRQHRMLVTQGKNLFPEEVETVLTALPGVVAASVQGVEDGLRGMQVVAVLALEAGVALDSKTVLDWCRQHLEAYKLPRRWLVADPWPMTVSGKTDHARLAQAVAATLGGKEQEEAQSWLRTLR